jgi:uncharacterized repeat protein (TIGR03803 family)
MKQSGWKSVCSILLFCVATATVSSAQVKLTTLVNFNGSNGGSPSMVLTQGANGSFYGTTEYGGINNNNFCTSGCGTFFKMAPTGTLKALYNFCSQVGCTDGTYPVGSLVQAPNGDFYGTTEGGGAYGGGTVFKISPSGDLTTLYSFCALADCADGEEPVAGLVQAKNGSFYGTTRVGGAYAGGTVFKISPAGELSTLYSFRGPVDSADGSAPVGELVQATNGNFYGETEDGGVNYQGTIFEITPGGEETALYSFCALPECTDGSAPYGGLIQAANGDFYGTTLEGGSHCAAGCGTIFKITSAGALTTLYNFCAVGLCADGRQPHAGLVQGTDGNFYGTTYYGGANNSCAAGCGTVFEITPAGTLTTLYSFCALTDCADGDLPGAGLLQATNGTFYGTTAGGGTGNDGTIFSLATGLGPFVSFVRNPAKVGQQFGILGQGLTGTTSVLLNGAAASFTIKSDTLLTATVPAGATTGYVTVSTPSGVLTSNVPFHVIP